MHQDEIEKLFQLAVEKIADPGEKSEALKGNKPDESLPSIALHEIGPEDIEKQTALTTAIREMAVPQRIKLALFGNMSARGILIRDTNRIIPRFVLQNARITENEIYDFAKNANLDESVLRAIASNGTWMKSYAVKLAIVSNPKVPADLSLKWLKYIQDKDLRSLAKSRNIPQLISSQARKLLEKRDH